jgi:hypothetical protein
VTAEPAEPTENHIVVTSPTQSDPGQQLLRRLAQAANEGGGADVANAAGLQITYSDPLRGNEVFLAWTENVSNEVDGVTIFVNGSQTASAPGLAGVPLPDTNFFAIPNVEAGFVNFRLEGGGTTAEVDLLVLDEQPFEDPTNFTCDEVARETETSTCRFRLSWDHTGPPPSFFWIYLEQSFRAEIPGEARELTFILAPPAVYTADIVAVQFDTDGAYQGSLLTSECTITCDPADCKSAYNLSIFQTDYTADIGDNRGVMQWQNGVIPYPEGITLSVDGTVFADVDGGTEGLFFTPVLAGEHTFGVQGNCAAGDTSAVTEVSLNILDETPHPNPITGTVDCVFDPGGPALTGTWTNADPSTEIDVYVETVTDLIFITTLDGDSTDVGIVGPLTLQDTLVLQFFTEVDGGKYGSPFVRCGQSTDIRRYIQGVCDGRPSAVGNPSLSSVIFTVQTLFQGGAAPPCRVACDSNGDQIFNISDAVYSLDHLFRGGPAPLLWIDSDQNGSADPTCTKAQIDDDCVTEHAFCAN